ncbi:hypothetical protein [Escherichia coli]|uniref:hypothetical protein n=1 Tax=Escherichia coli TaxID=562 RepID=UPI00313EA7F4
MTNLTKHADLILLLDQQPDLVKLFLRVLWKTLALPPEDDLWKELSEGFSEMCEKTHHKRLINMLETHKDFFEPALTALYRQSQPDFVDAVALCNAARRSNKGAKDFHHDLQELTDQMRDILHR